YRDCISCHDPHYQTRIGDENTDRFDPVRPIQEQCGVCHEARSTLPSPSSEDEGCMTCHQEMKADDPEDTKRINQLCLHCHGKSGTEAQAITGRSVPLIDEESHESTTHAAVACTTCHREAASFIHHEQESVECGQCHLPHHEKIAHDAHVTVSCQSCHLKGIRAVREAESKCIRWEKDRSLEDRSIIHEMVRFDEETSCQKCHFAGNMLGAASMALPAKSIICMPCHAATFSVDDTITIVALLIFVCGLLIFFSVYLSGSLPGIANGNPFAKLFKLLTNAVSALFSGKIVLIIRSLFWDIFLQRRLYRQSPKRWIIHALIFYPFVFRFFWGLLALFGSLWKPEWPVVWDMVNKNYPLTGFLFDLTGVMILVGVGLAFARGWLNRADRASSLPEQDRVALGLIGGIVIIGFVLEGMRIALTGYPAGAEYSIIGYWISLLFSAPRGLTDVYGFVWYIHAALTGAFIAYIPFSRLLHIIIAPMVAAMNALEEK
ncbi:MAG: respiratory nitrate reductase subunit gamma, partial [Deltaproteobacteria bacterium]|nr:respiratory nitrate reductase subunit gamma [Deltaproteobacteria bacterium]